MLAETEFPHRRNSDGTWDSICKGCFLTIAHGKAESELDEVEKSHVCNSSFLAERGHLHQPSDPVEASDRLCIRCLEFNLIKIWENGMLETSRMKVLVADDEGAIADTLAVILSKAGFETRAVYSGEAAVEMAEYFRPNMLITDVLMGGISGIDAAIKIDAMLPDCKILLFSGQAASVDLLEKARNQGHEFEILAKPVHPSDLLTRLRSLVAA